jgi:2-polyprenyl-6-methoxyphenol hydroxylase-like FAD-dependent oxidoreductase
MLQKIPAGHLHTNCRVVGVELADPGSAIIELESGERICGHLVIAADG